MNYNKLRKEATDGAIHDYAYGMGQWVEVSEEVYKFMESSERKERYYRSRCRRHHVLSLERMIEDMDDNADFVTCSESLLIESPELLRLQEEKNYENSVKAERLLQIINGLNEGEKELAEALLLSGKSIREYASEHGLTRKAVRDRDCAVCKWIREQYEKEYGGESYDEQ